MAARPESAYATLSGSAPSVHPCLQYPKTVAAAATVLATVGLITLAVSIAAHRQGQQAGGGGGGGGLPPEWRPPGPVHPPPGGDAVFGGQATREAFEGWLHQWRSSYEENDGMVPELPDASLPAALRGVKPKVVISSGGAAGGVVSEGMGYAIMVEAFKAAAGDRTALENGLSFTRAWLGMVVGPSDAPQPLGGGVADDKKSSTRVGTWPYGVSAVVGNAGESSASGVPAWKFPLDQCAGKCVGSATDGDEDAVLGMIYLAAALDYPDDFVDMVVRAIIGFASADLGFPDLFRTLPQDGRRVFVPKGGSQWGGLLPPEGPHKSGQEPWCYNPSYFAPGHYRAFRDFVEARWQGSFDAYLPAYLDGSSSSLSDLINAFDGAVLAGYNILYRSSCASGSVSNWVGVQAPCDSPEALGCPGVPWASTPMVGKDGTCTASGTAFGAYGADASRTPWRIAIDYILYKEESSAVTMYDAAGSVDPSITFNAQVYLNRFAYQYVEHAQCDGGKAQGCVGANGEVATYKLASAFDTSAPGLTCPNVPNSGDAWWAAFMSYPTFTAFVAPLEKLTREESANWLDTFGSICTFKGGGEPQGGMCSTSYFEAGQELIATMVMSGAVVGLPGASYA